MSDEFAEVKAARLKHDQARAAVVAWMDAESRTCRLRQNSQAPGWGAYQKALRELDDARTRAGV